MRKLEARGTLKGYAAQIDPKALGLGLLAFVAVRSDEAGSENRIAEALAELPRSSKCTTSRATTATSSRVRARDAEHLGHLLRTRFSRVPGVRSTRTTIVLETRKRNPAPPDCETRGGAGMTPAAEQKPTARIFRLGGSVS